MGFTPKSGFVLFMLVLCGFFVASQFPLTDADELAVTDKSNNSTRNGKKRRKRSSNIGPKVFDNNNLAAVVTGLPPDCRFVLDTMTSIATDHRSNFGASIQPGMLAEKIASMFHKLSLQSSSDRRLLAVEVIIASRNEIVYLDCSGM